MGNDRERWGNNRSVEGSWHSELASKEGGWSQIQHYREDDFPYLQFESLLCHFVVIPNESEYR